MANNRRTRRQYHTYGSVAYQSDYDGSAVRAPRREELQRSQPQRKPQVQPRRRVVERPRIEVREAGAFSPFAIVGFAVVAICTALLLIANAQLAVINDQTVELRSQLATLQTEQNSLLAQYELSYDLDAIETQLTSDGSMVKLQPSQVTYLDVSEPDSVVFYESQGQGVEGILSAIKGFFYELLS